jgi:transcriptional regulator with XRE-family HTH domain
VRVSNVERGTENPTLEVCARFAAAVGVTIDDIVLSSGDMTLSEAVDTVALDSLINSMEATVERLQDDLAALREWRAALSRP